jgi:hypothetical protein
LSESVGLDAETLRARLDERWPDAVGARRASTDETHLHVQLHPEYDGIVSLHVTARADLDGVFVVPDPDLVDIVTSHHRTGPLARGQELPIDLELHPGKVREPASSGLLELVDASGDPVAPPVRLTLATDPALDCVLAGTVDGPFGDVAAFAQAVDELRAGRGSARRLAQRVEALHDGREDPGWSRLPWRRG